VTRTTLPLSSIVIGDRQRTDLGNLADLIESMRSYGLIQPVVINQDRLLIAGGRRIAAAQELGWTDIDVVYKETLSQEQLMEMELEENLRRKDMNWRERCLSVARIHRMKKSSAALDGEKWGQMQTGEMLGVTAASINYTLKVAEELEKQPQGVIAQCEGLTEAYKKLLFWDEQQALRELARRTTPEAIISSTKTGDGIVSIAPSKESFVVPLSNMLHFSDCLEFIQTILPPESIDHIVTDPPYGVDVEMMDQQNIHGGILNIDTIRATHQVEENVALFYKMLPLFYKVLKPNSFLCLWCDIMQWQLLYDLCIECGFKVQRWPVVWDKTHACINNAAAFNFTKNIELCLIARKGTPTPPLNPSNGVGNRTGVNESCLVRSPSRKRNNLSLMMAPPKFPPYWDRWNGRVPPPGVDAPPTERSRNRPNASP